MIIVDSGRLFHWLAPINFRKILYKTSGEMKRKQTPQMIQDLQAGCNDCLKDIFENYGTQCIEFLKSRTGCRHEDAEDIFVDAVVNFRDKAIAGQISHLSNLRGYLYSTCLNMWRERTRSRIRWQNQETEIVEKFYNHQWEPLLEETELERKLHAAKDAFNSMSERCKDVLYYFYVDNLRFKEITELMGLANTDVAKTFKYKSLQRLRNEARDRYGLGMA